ncbi:MAG: DinB family protein [Gemmatimonadota bacterium]|nr:MAG: DinB family protein [Gemmatimonadota bacterium]
MEFQLDRTLEILRSTSGTLRALLAGLSDEWIRCNEGPDTWSPFDIVGHLIHGEQTDWIARIRIILEAGELRTFTPFDRSAQFEESRGKTLGELLDTFETLRESNLRTLDELNIQPTQLELTGAHPALGRVTLRQLLATWVVHDLGHIAQMARVMAKGYADDVGPWGAYLSVLKDRS